jgi:beta-xylosidase
MYSQRGLLLTLRSWMRNGARPPAVARRLSAAVAAFGLLALSAAASSCAPWVADQGDGTYENPILFADYSDPDVIRVGQDFYLTSSSFNCVPGLPILHSRDLVNWRIIGHAARRLSERFNSVQPGNGLWAPSLRYHDGHYWIFVGDPDLGILMTRAVDPAGPWEPLHVVEQGKGLIDPCPLWDGDKAYLVHAYAKSRSGKNSILVVSEMSSDGRRLIGDEHLVVDGRDGSQPTIEGPKFYKRNGWYYIFAPAGGVKEGWQVVARGKHPFGPYEVRRVMEQGSTTINGPHQGGWVELENGQGWFVHFQDRGAYGRVVHLNPVRWIDDWPVIGEDPDGDGVGEPVSVFRKPDVGASGPIETPQESDDFNGSLGLQWQWQANPAEDWASLDSRPGCLRLYAMRSPAGDLTAVPNQLLQKFPAPAFVATTMLTAVPKDDTAQAGLVVMGQTYAGLMVNQQDGDLHVRQVASSETGPRNPDDSRASIPRFSGPVWLRVAVESGARCTFSYSTDGRSFTPIGKPFVATPGRWIGAKVGILCIGEGGHADFDWFKIE